jgi:DNA mismatch endonuclease (patch repair protein)
VLRLERSSGGWTLQIEAAVVDRADMTDTRTPEKRRQIMTAVRQRDTTPELRLRRALYAAGLRGWRCNVKRLPGRPDIAWLGLQIAVFVDGAFWHGHPSRHRPGRSGAYWDEKIAGNVERDRRVDHELIGLGWTVIRTWDFEVHKALPSVVERIETALVERRQAGWAERLGGSTRPPA